MPRLRDRQGILTGAVGLALGPLPGSCCKKPLLEFKLWQAPGHSMQSVSAELLPHSLRRLASSQPQLCTRLHSCSQLPYRKLAIAVVCTRLTVPQLRLHGGGSSILCRQLLGKAWSSGTLLAGSQLGCRSQQRSKMAGMETLLRNMAGVHTLLCIQVTFCYHVLTMTSVRTCVTKLSLTYRLNKHTSTPCGSPTLLSASNLYWCGTGSFTGSHCCLC